MTTPHEAALTVPQVGEAAPDFKAPSYPAGTIALADFKGKKNVLLCFYPKDMTPGCTKEMCDFSDDLSKFNNANTQVLGISCDSVGNHEKFAAEYGLTVPLLADEDGSIAHAYGAIREGGRMANRILFVIDKQGVVQHVAEGMPNNAELLAIVERLT
jgi:peroxiredoxin Q/BCP